MESTDISEAASPPGERPARRRQCDRTALSDARLTEAAIELIVQTGIQGTTLQAVGERAGYSRALATHPSRPKAGLFTPALHTASADWLTLWRHLLSMLDPGGAPHNIAAEPRVRPAFGEDAELPSNA